MRYIPECRCKRCGTLFSPITAAVSMQGLREIIAQEMRSAAGAGPAIFIHDCDDGGKGIGDLIGAAPVPRAEETPRQKKSGQGKQRHV
jgi:hypothetical protein